MSGRPDLATLAAQFVVLVAVDPVFDVVGPSIAVL